MHDLYCDSGLKRKEKKKPTKEISQLTEKI